MYVTLELTSNVIAVPPGEPLEGMMERGDADVASLYRLQSGSELPYSEQDPTSAFLSSECPPSGVERRNPHDHGVDIEPVHLAQGGDVLRRVRLPQVKPLMKRE